MKVRVLQLNGYAIAGVEVSTELLYQDCDQLWFSEKIVFYAQNRLIIATVLTCEAGNVGEYDEIYNEDLGTWEWVDNRHYQQYSQDVKNVDILSNFCIIPEFDEMIENYYKQQK